MMGSASHRLCIAIDGPAGAGKSTVARKVAQALGYVYVDTGAMYRAVAWAVQNQEIDPQDASAVAHLAETVDIRLTADGRVLLDDRDITREIRTPSISTFASSLSALPRVRRRLVALQKEMGAGGGVVMEGRDIGTVVLPQAQVKVYLTASLDQRVARRERELAGSGMGVAWEDLKSQIAERDARDRSRDTAPMRPAPDAVILESDHLSADQVVAHILALHKEALRRGNQENG